MCCPKISSESISMGEGGGEGERFGEAFIGGDGGGGGKGEEGKGRGEVGRGREPSR